MGQRILALSIPAHNFVDLKAGKEGMLYLLEEPTGIREGPPQNTLHKYDLTKRKFDKVLDGVTSFEVSHDGEKMLIRQQQRFTIAKAGEAPKPGEGALKIDSLEVRVDPMQEWKQMFR
jgi:tricorn protease